MLFQSRTEALSLVVNPSTLSSFTTNPQSPLYPFYASESHRPATAAYTLNPELIETVLYRFTQKQPEPFFVQQKLIDGSWKYTALHSNLRDFVSGKVDFLPAPDQPVSSLLRQKEEELEKLHGVVRDMTQELKKSTQEKDVGVPNDPKALQAKNKEFEALRKSMTTQEQKHREEVERLSGMIQERDNEVQQLRKLSQEKEQELQKIRKGVKAKAKELEVLCGSVSEQHSEHDERQGDSERLEKLTREKNEEIRKLRKTIQEKNREIRKLTSNNVELEPKDSKSADYQGEIRSSGINAGLHSQQNVDEYAASTRVQARDVPEERIEQAQIMKGLKDVNRLIEELGHSISIYLVDHFSPPATSIEAVFRSRELLNILGYSKRNPPSVKALRGARLDIEDFFFHVVRAILCYQLYTQLFEPFHPGIVDNKPQNDLINDIYMQMMYRGQSNSRFVFICANRLSYRTPICDRSLAKGFVQLYIRHC